MHIEVQVALNFVISYLYNKLPRRRVNIFGEELEKALKDKFQGHWYPDKPFRGSAFRCLKTGSPVDRVLERAARESGVPVEDVLENLPRELAVWVDPGEVSYRIGEKGLVKVLYSEKAAAAAAAAVAAGAQGLVGLPPEPCQRQQRPEDMLQEDREVTKTFNPEAQCFRPIDSVSGALSALSLSPGGKPPFPAAVVTPPAAPSPTPFKAASPAPALPGAAAPPAPGGPPPAPFIPRSTQPLTFTTATFAQTKFGSTKLKTSSKRANRMSPTEFSNYIKQRAMQQQLHQQQQQQQVAAAAAAAAAAAQAASHQQQHSPAGRALSPDPSAAYYFPLGHHYPPPFPPRAAAGFDSSPLLQFEPSPPFYPGGGMGGPQPTPNAPQVGGQAPSGGQDKLDNNWPYSGQYQHLLVAN